MGMLHFPGDQITQQCSQLKMWGIQKDWGDTKTFSKRAMHSLVFVDMLADYFAFFFFLMFPKGHLILNTYPFISPHQLLPPVTCMGLTILSTVWSLQTRPSIILPLKRKAWPMSGIRKRKFIFVIPATEHRLHLLWPKYQLFEGRLKKKSFMSETLICHAQIIWHLLNSKGKRRQPAFRPSAFLINFDLSHFSISCLHIHFIH